MKRKLIPVLLALCLFIWLLPATSIPTPATETTIVTGFTATAGTTANETYSINSNEGFDKLVDGTKNDTGNKWCVYGNSSTFYPPIYIEFKSDAPFVPTGYILTTGGDSATWKGRNPKNWTIKAKVHADDTDWTTLAEVKNNTTMGDYNLRSYSFDINNPSATSYQYFRFEVSAIQSGSVFQLAEFEFKGSYDPAELGFATVSSVEASYDYIGSAIQITPSVTATNGTQLTLGTHYDVTLDGAQVSEYPISVTGLGLHTLTFTGKDNYYTGSKTVVFSVTPPGISVDPDYQPNDTGYFYVNMPANGTTTKTNPATVNIDGSLVTSLKVYDDGGKNSHYSKGNKGYLLLNAPEGCGLKISGNVAIISNRGSLSVYDGSGTDRLLGEYTESSQDIGELYTTGQRMLLYFSSWDIHPTKSGLDLSVEVVPPYDLTLGSIENLAYSYPINTLYSEIVGSVSVKDRYGAVMLSDNYTVSVTKDGNTVETQTLSDSGVYTLTATGKEPYFNSVSKTFLVYGTELTRDENNAYLIRDDADWITFVRGVNDGTYTTGTFKLTTNIRITEMAGIYSNTSSDAHPFSGTFDGQGHTLTTDFTVREAYGAPFRYVRNANFQNLTVDGNIIINGTEGNPPYSCSGGLVGYAKGDVSITGCRSSVVIKSTVERASYVGGFIGFYYPDTENNATVTFQNCIFDGKLVSVISSSSTYYWNGFVGHFNNYHVSLVLSNCICAPKALGSGEYGASFCYSFVYGASPNFSTCYYTRLVSTNATAQGQISAESVPTDTLATKVTILGMDVYPCKDAKVTVGIADESGIVALTGSDLASAILSDITVTYGGVTLTKDTHYTVSISPAQVVNEGDYTLTVSSIEDSDYYGSKSITVKVRKVLAGAGTEAEPYLIANSEDWTIFANNISAGRDYSGQYVALTADVTVDKMAGSEANHPFKGTFTGKYQDVSHTLTFNYNTTEANNAAPFSWLDGATIRDLTVKGTITTSKKYAAGIAAHTKGSVKIQNCVSAVNVSSGTNGDGTHGGFVGVSEGGSISFENCAFTGSIINTNRTELCGGYVGYVSNSSSISYTDCLQAGTLSLQTEDGSATFNRNGQNSFVRTYYLTPYGTTESGAVQVFTEKPEGISIQKTLADGKSYYIPCTIDMTTVFKHTGNPIEIPFSVSVSGGGETLTLDNDYTAMLGDEQLHTNTCTVTNADSYTVTITGLAPYCGTRTVNIIVQEGVEFVDLANLTGDITLTDGSVVTGSLKSKVGIKIAAGATIILNGMKFEGTDSTDSQDGPGLAGLGDAIIVLADNTVNEIRTNSNSDANCYYRAGLNVPENNTLTIMGGGTLTIFSAGAGIGSDNDNPCGNIVIESGVISARSYNSYPAIGAGERNCGSITINGGTVTATSDYLSAGIGGGYYSGSCGDILISGGTVTATSYSCAGIGGGYFGSCGDILISGGTVTATSDYYCAGIGGGYSGSCGDILIRGGTVTATGDYYGAGIGGGYSYSGSCGDISISGGTVTATGGSYGAGIGTGKGGSCGNITITGGKVTANGGNFGEGIGRVSGVSSDTNIILSCGEDDFILASSIKPGTGENNKVTVAEGITLCDENGNNIFTGELDSTQLAAMANTKLGRGFRIEVTEPVKGSLRADKKAVPLFGENKTVTLTVIPDNEYAVSAVSYRDSTGNHLIEAVNGGYSFEPNEDSTVEAHFALASAAENFIYDVEESAWLIQNADGWGAFCDMLEDGYTFAGETVKLNASIGTKQVPITRQAGSSGKDFSGTFDGNRKTITVDLIGQTVNANIAPFYYLRPQDGSGDTVTIKNLKVDGQITTAGKYAAGIAYGCHGKVNITNCVSSVTISSSVSLEGYHGGFISKVNKNSELTFAGCAFTGKMLSIGSQETQCWGGFVGDAVGNNVYITVNASIYAPAELEAGEKPLEYYGNRNFIRGGTSTSYTKSFYTRSLLDEYQEDGRAYVVAAGDEYVTIDYGTQNETYNVSGITSTEYGLIIGGKLYCAEGTSLTLSHKARAEDYGAFTGYIANMGTINGNTFTMSNEPTVPYGREKAVTVYTQWANEPKFQTQSLTLSGQIGVNFYMDLSAFSGDVDYTNSYMTFDIKQKNCTRRANYDPAKKNRNESLYGFTCYINSIQMAEPIIATFHYQKDNKWETVVREYRAEDYFIAFEDLVKKEEITEPKVISLVRALCNFGFFIQPFLAQSQNWKEGTQYEAMTENYSVVDYFNYDPEVYEYKYDEIKSDLQRDRLNVHMDNNSGGDIASATYSLSLDSSTGINVYFKRGDGYDGTISVTVDNAPSTYTLDPEKGYRVKITDIPAHLLSQMHTIVVTTTKGSVTVNVSALSYVYTVLKFHENNYNKTNMAAVSSFYAYAKAADAYLSNTAQSSQ